jgi:DNA-binding response OmpR family regulator
MPDKIKVLLIEDDAMVVKMYERKFNKEDFALTTAFNGEEGMAVLNNNHPDIVLLDIMMPLMNGLEVLKAVRTNQKLRDIPVVMLTNLGDRPEDIQKCKELGAFDYWVKANTSLSDIASRIKNIIGKKE